MNSLDKLTHALEETVEVKRFKHLEKMVMENDHLKSLYQELNLVSKEIVNCKHLELEEALRLNELRYSEILNELNDDVLFCEYQNALRDVKNILNVITDSLESKLDSWINE